MAFDINQWLKNNTPEKTLVSFTGPVDSDVITRLVEETESKFTELYPENGKMLKIIIHVLVESLQNIFHHACPDESGNEKSALLSVSSENNAIKVIIGNFLPSSKLHIVKDRIEQINALEKEELKTLYKLILSNHEFSEKGGGGLGLIDIAKKTGTKMEYNFVPLNENLYFYILKITIV